MKQPLKQSSKYLILLFVGGSIYYTIELLYRSYSHPTMFLLGGICFVCLGLINEILPWQTPLWLQSLLGGAIITILEFITGVIVNIWLGWNVWDYSNVSLNLLGQICLPFSICWCFLAIVGILLDDYLRWKLFNEDKPHYKLW